MQTIIGLIFAVVITIAIPMGAVCIIATIREKRDNRSRLEREILRNGIIESYENNLTHLVIKTSLSPNTIDELYREYKSIGGNGYLTQLYIPTEYKPKHIVHHFDSHTLSVTHISPRIHNCINCGAPLRKDQHKCEYCNTEYF